MMEEGTEQVTIERLYCNECDGVEPHVLQQGVGYHCLRCRAEGRDTVKRLEHDRRYRPDPRD